MKKTIGILGGMGPYATLEFYNKILNFTDAEKDWDHLRIIIDSNPHIPSRTRCILYNEKSPVEGMIESLKKLENYPVDIIAIPCNSACYFIDDIQHQINIPILNIMQITSLEVKKQFSNAKKVGVLGGRITYKEETYKKFLDDLGIEYVSHSLDDQCKIENFIEQIKKNELNEELELSIKNFIVNFKFKYKVDVLILGCTEFGCVLNLDINLDIVDSSTALAKYIVCEYS